MHALQFNWFSWRFGIGDAFYIAWDLIVYSWNTLKVCYALTFIELSGQFNLCILICTKLLLNFISIYHVRTKFIFVMKILLPYYEIDLSTNGSVDKSFFGNHLKGNINFDHIQKNIYCQICFYHKSQEYQARYTLCEYVNAKYMSVLLHCYMHLYMMEPLFMYMQTIFY